MAVKPIAKAPYMALKPILSKHELDVSQANILWWKQHNEKVQAIEEQMLAESRTTMTEEEKASLYDETGRNFFPLPGQHP